MSAALLAAGLSTERSQPGLPASWRPHPDPAHSCLQPQSTPMGSWWALQPAPGWGPRPKGSQCPRGPESALPPEAQQAPSLHPARPPGPEPPSGPSYLPATFHSLVHLLQEVPLPAALGVADGRGVGGLGDEQGGPALVDPGGPGRAGAAQGGRAHSLQAFPDGTRATVAPHGPGNTRGQTREEALPPTGALGRCSGPPHIREGRRALGQGRGSAGRSQHTPRPTHPRCRSGVML